MPASSASPANQPLIAADNLPAQAALAALTHLPAVEPVPALTLSAEGRLLIVGTLDVALGWASRLQAQREVTVLALDADAAEVAELAAENEGMVLLAGSAPSLTGHLGAFELQWQAGAQRLQGQFDVVLDLSADALLKRVELPPGYAAPGRDPLDQALAVIDLLAFDGEYEKPRYVSYNERLCAHGRSQKAGCNACVESCASEAIISVGEKISLDPYLCQGCATCTTVCPSGALSFQFPRLADVGLALKTQLQAWREAGGAAPRVLFHSSQSGRQALRAMQRAGQALPADVLLVEVWSADGVGLELMLGAVAFGAAQVAVFGAGSHDLAPLRKQAAIGQAVLSGLGYAGDYLCLIDAEAADPLAALRSAAPVPLPAAEFRLLADKRTTLEFVIDHLVKQAPAKPDSLPLPAGAPFGTVSVADACTLCMACTSACPAGALKAAADAPRLSFIERNCLQCGLCANTCPEQAITLTPRLLIAERRHERVLREAEVFCCTACGKAMGAAPTILNMISKLSGHSMFATPEAKARLSMCGDCRVIDLIQKEDSVKAWEMTE